MCHHALLEGTGDGDGTTWLESPSPTTSTSGPRRIEGPRRTAASASRADRDARMADDSGNVLSLYSVDSVLCGCRGSRRRIPGGVE
jgi:hypothetical protein